MIFNTETIMKSGIHTMIQDQISSLMENAEVQSWKKDQVIFYADHKPLGIYLIESGQIVLEFPDPNKKEETLISNKHCILGLDFLLADIPYPFSAKAVIATKTWFISRHHVMTLCQDIRES